MRMTKAQKDELYHSAKEAFPGVPVSVVLRAAACLGLRELKRDPARLAEFLRDEE